MAQILCKWFTLRRILELTMNFQTVANYTLSPEFVAALTEYDSRNEKRMESDLTKRDLVTHWFKMMFDAPGLKARSAIPASVSPIRHREKKKQRWRHNHSDTSRHHNRYWLCGRSNNRQRCRSQARSLFLPQEDVWHSSQRANLLPIRLMDQHLRRYLPWTPRAVACTEAVGLYRKEWKTERWSEYFCT